MSHFFYLRWTSEGIKGLSFAELFTEVDSKGKVLREIGVDSNGNIVHRAPSNQDNYGIFDLQVIKTFGLQSDLDSKRFNQLWKRAEESIS